MVKIILKIMGILDIFRRKKSSFSMDNVVRITLPDGNVLSRINSKPQKEFKIRKCRECGRSVKHTCISERYGAQDLGGMQQIRQIWAISIHKYGKIKCRGSNRRYKKQFIR